MASGTCRTLLGCRARRMTASTLLFLKPRCLPSITLNLCWKGLDRRQFVNKVRASHGPKPLALGTSWGQQVKRDLACSVTSSGTLVGFILIRLARKSYIDYYSESFSSSASSSHPLVHLLVVLSNMWAPPIIWSQPCSGQDLCSKGLPHLIFILWFFDKVERTTPVNIVDVSIATAVPVVAITTRLHGLHHLVRIFCTLPLFSKLFHHHPQPHPTDLLLLFARQSISDSGLLDIKGSTEINNELKTNGSSSIRGSIYLKNELTSIWRIFFSKSSTLNMFLAISLGTEEQLNYLYCYISCISRKNYFVFPNISQILFPNVMCTDSF